MQTSEHAPDAGDRGRTRPRGAYAKSPIAERRYGGRRFRQDGPQPRNSRQVRKASCHEAQEEFVGSLAELEELVRHDRPSPRQTSPLESGPRIYVFEDDTGFVILTLYMDDVLLLGANKHLLTTLKKQIMDRHGMTDMGDMSRVLGMNVTRNRTKRTITNDQEDTTEDIAERFGMKGYYSAFKPGAGPERSLNQQEQNLLDKEDKRRDQLIVGATMYHAEGFRYGVFHAVDQLARGMSKPAEAYIRVIKHLPRSLARSTDFFITCKWGDFEPAAFPDAN